MRVIIAGGRDFADYKLLEERLDYYLARVALSTVTIISGAAFGADSFGIRYAEDREMECIKMPAEWNTHGKRAGYLRNVEMAKVATHLVAFWDGESRGTKHMIDIAAKEKLPTRIVYY